MKVAMQRRLARNLVTLLVTGVASLACAQQDTNCWKFMVYGDTRGTSVGINTNVLRGLAQETTNIHPDFVLVPGDLANSGSTNWFLAWSNIMAPVYQAGIGVYPVMGSHDTNDVPAWRAVFGPDLPDNGPPGEVDRTYALIHKNALVLALDTERTVSRVNLPWVNDALTNNTKPHVFAMGHQPAFHVYHDDCLDDYPAARNAFWNMLSNANCKIYFCGHDHFYDHIRLDDGDGDDGNDVHQMIVGTGGCAVLLQRRPL